MTEDEFESNTKWRYPRHKARYQTQTKYFLWQSFQDM